MIYKGFIMLNRDFTAWEWYTEVNCCKVFIHCLIKANYSPKRWQGNFIDKGEFITSYEILAAETGLTVSKVRTALAKIEKSEYIQVTTTASFTKIHVLNIHDFVSEPNLDDVDTVNKSSKEQSLQGLTHIEKPTLANTSQTDDNHLADTSQAIDKPMTNTSQTNDNHLATTNTHNNNNLKNRKKIFREKVFAQTNFNSKILNSFFDYWSELDSNSEKMRFESHRFFEVKKRLDKWLANERPKTVNNNPKNELLTNR